MPTGLQGSSAILKATSGVVAPYQSHDSSTPLVKTAPLIILSSRTSALLSSLLFLPRSPFALSNVSLPLAHALDFLPSTAQSRQSDALERSVRLGAVCHCGLVIADNDLSHSCLRVEDIWS